MSPATILLTGGTGQVGGELLPLLRSLGRVSAPVRAELNLTDPVALRKLVRDLKPTWIVNAAAYTAVDKAESETEEAYTLNRDVPGLLGEEAAKLGAAVLHFSTDYVFSGTGTIPWREEDPTGPLSVYGASKLAGEQALQATGAAHLIFRTSWVYGTQGSNFLRTILRLASEREELSVVSDQYGAPTWSRNLAHLAAHTMTLAGKRQAAVDLSLAETLSPLSGVYHACDAGVTTWYGFAQEILWLAGVARPAQRFAKLTAVTAARYPTAARRPANSRMDCDKLRQTFTYSMPSWQQSLALAVPEFLAPSPDGTCLSSK